MRRRGQGLALAAAAAAVALALAGAALAALNGRAASHGTPVKVTEREYHIALSRTSAPAGTVTFSIHNAGKIAHGFAVAGAGVKAMTLKTIAPGATKTLTVKLSGGKLSIWCPQPGHAKLGMKASLAVKSTSSSGGTAGGNTGGTTTSGGGGSWG
jgi:iron uptake system component EfeO